MSKVTTIYKIEIRENWIWKYRILVIRACSIPIFGGVIRWLLQDIEIISCYTDGEKTSSYTLRGVKQMVSQQSNS